MLAAVRRQGVDLVAVLRHVIDERACGKDHGRNQPHDRRSPTDTGQHKRNRERNEKTDGRPRLREQTKHDLATGFPGPTPGAFQQHGPQAKRHDEVEDTAA